SQASVGVVPAWSIRPSTSLASLIFTADTGRLAVGDCCRTISRLGLKWMEGAYIEDQDGRRICFGIPKRAFDLFGLSLDGRAAADADEHLSFWMSADKQAIGVVFRQGCTFGHLVMRRRGD